MGWSGQECHLSLLRNTPWQETQAQGQAGSSIKVHAGLDHLGLPAYSNISLVQVQLKKDLEYPSLARLRQKKEIGFF